MAAPPVMLVVAGPPGSGKSTFFPVSGFGIDAFNIDDRCAQLIGSYRAISREVREVVAKECQRFVEQHIAGQRSFAVETTMRTLAAARQAEAARARGFFTELMFVATNSADLNVQRVIQRAHAGGHAASEGEVRRVYEASLANLPEAMRAFEISSLYDTSTPWAPARLGAVVANRVLDLREPVPEWTTRTLRGWKP